MLRCDECREPIGGDWHCTECRLWGEKHPGHPMYYSCCRPACVASHQERLKDHPAHEFKELYKRDRDEYQRRVFGRVLTGYKP